MDKTEFCLLVELRINLLSGFNIDRENEINKTTVSWSKKNCLSSYMASVKNFTFRNSHIVKYWYLVLHNLVLFKGDSDVFTLV